MLKYILQNSEWGTTNLREIAKGIDLRMMTLLFFQQSLRLRMVADLRLL